MEANDRLAGIIPAAAGMIEQLREDLNSRQHSFFY